jgi:hypothetical protein
MRPRYLLLALLLILPAHAVVSVERACLHWQYAIEEAKANIAARKNLKPGDTITPAEIEAERNTDFPRCPSGGAYTIGPVGVFPSCSIPAHSQPRIERHERIHRQFNLIKSVASQPFSIAVSTLIFASALILWMRKPRKTDLRPNPTHSSLV